MIEIHEAAYIPVLAVRPAEMNALKELPERDKELLLPAIQLRPWVGSHEFANTIKKVREVFGNDRQWIANLDGSYVAPEPGIDPATGEIKEQRQAITDFESLRNPANGYENWCDFIEENEALIPCLQLTNIAQFNAQLARLTPLGRGLVLHLNSLTQVPAAAQLAGLQAAATNNQILFIIDCGELGYRNDLNSTIMQWSASLDTISSAIPTCRIAISSTSFPHEFSNGALSQEIRERQLFAIAAATAQQHDWNLVYSDRGSARLQVPRGGGGVPYPRIDYPTTGTWYFFRSDSQDGEYQSVAQETMDNENWNPNLRIWGTQMIERTAQGDEYAIVSPVKATAVRINIHMHQQLFYGQPDNLLDTDDEWVD
jgi:hypothetical protein